MQACRLFLLLFTFLFSCVEVRAGNSRPIEVGYSVAQWSVEEFKQLNPAVRVAYVRGLTGGMLASPVITRDSQKIKALEKCVAWLDGEALLLIVDSYIATHSETQTMPMEMVYPIALIYACKSKGVEIQNK